MAAPGGPVTGRGKLDRLVPLALLMLAAFYALYVAKAVFMPIAIAIVLFFVLSPLNRVLIRIGIPGPLSAGILVLGVLLILGASLSVAAAPASQWIERGPSVWEEIRAKVRPIMESVENVKDATKKIEEITDQSSSEDKSRVVVKDTPGILERIFTGAQDIMTTSGIVLILLFFILLSGHRLSRQLALVLGNGDDQNEQIIAQIETNVSAYLGWFSLINVGLGCAIALAMWALGLPTPYLWGIMAALLNFIPYVGGLIGMGVVGVVALISLDDSWWFALIASGAYAGLNAIESSLITPMVLGRRLQLNPIVIFVSTIFWTWLWGIPGAILAVPFLIILYCILNQAQGLDRFAALMGSETQSKLPLRHKPNG